MKLRHQINAAGNMMEDQMNNTDLNKVFDAAVYELQKSRQLRNLCEIDVYSCLLQVNNFGDVMLEYEDDETIKQISIDVERSLSEDIDDVLKAEVNDEISERTSAMAKLAENAKVRDVELMNELANIYSYTVTKDD